MLRLIPLDIIVGPEKPTKPALPTNFVIARDTILFVLLNIAVIVAIVMIVILIRKSRKKDK